MIRNIIWFFALFLLLIIQAGVLMPLNIAPVNFILIIVAISAILSDFRQGIIISLLGGLLLDFTSGLPDGVLTLSLLSVFLFLHMLFNEILSREPNQYILAASVGFSTLSFYLIYLVIITLVSIFNLTAPPDFDYIFRLLPLAVILNLIFGYPIFRYYLWIQNLVSKLPSNEEPIRT